MDKIKKGSGSIILLFLIESNIINIMKSIFLFILFWGVIEFPASGDCSYYLQLEGQKSCHLNKNNGPDYLLSYGYFYCVKFESLFNNSSRSLKTFITGTKNCLQNKIKIMSDEKYSCEQLEKFAFETHSECYLENGYCQLSKNDRFKILSTITQINLLSKVDKTFLQYTSVINKCWRAGEYHGAFDALAKIAEDYQNLRQLQFLKFNFL